jgi:flagellar export protein FliJ
MTSYRTVKSLDRLVDLREREVDRLSADVAAKQTTRGRYLRNLARLEQLSGSSGPSGAPARATPGAPLFPALSLNSGGYKQTVLRITAAHRVDLSLHEADLAVAQHALAGATRRHEALDLLRRRERERALQARSRREQQRQDEIAAQMWGQSFPWRGRT